jgi:FkbM family methyltransferase
MLSKITRKIHSISRQLENPVLFQLQQQGGLPTTYEKLDTPWFKSLKIDTVLDIGANTGQFTRTIAALLPTANIYSFEPLPECFEKLQLFADKHNNIKTFNIGIGDESGTISFEQNESSQSSSFRKMTDTHKTAFPFTEKSTTVEVKIDKLDSIARNINFGDSLMIKIDVQGYEDKVLGGGKETISKAKIVIVETSFVTLYEAQPLFDDVYNVFTLWGFSFYGMVEQIADPITGQILQGDAIFIK